MGLPSEKEPQGCHIHVESIMVDDKASQRVTVRQAQIANHDTLDVVVAVFGKTFNSNDQFKKIKG